MTIPAQKKSYFPDESPLLSEQLRRDQAYHSEWRNFLNKEFNGWGIVNDDELKLSVNQEGTQVTIFKGLAIAEMGAPIAVYEGVRTARSSPNPGPAAARSEVAGQIPDLQGLGRSVWYRRDRDNARTRWPCSA